MLDLKQIEIRIARATTLPILPDIATTVLAMSDDPDYSARDYERVISRDTALTAKILRTANSPLFGGNGQITSLQRAITLLGMNTLRSICIAVAFQSSLYNRRLNRRFDPVHFWQHSMATGCAARVLACIMQCPRSGEAFLAGLLHDIGKLVLGLYLPEELDRVYDLMQAKHISQYEAEQICFDGLTHQDVGRMAAERWNLPSVYVTPIAKHHNPTEDVFEIDPLTACVHVGNCIAHEIDQGILTPTLPQDADPLVLDFLQVPEPQYEAIRKAIAREIERCSAIHSRAA
ncbi:MAG: HDOD domain-containing protein [Chthonomonadaceae bacterium]|nr:HDOD domain-containing protein [Chthonomonadaceae bacterium]